MFKKIIYFIVVGFFAIAVYYLNYQTDQYNHTLNIIDTAIEEKRYIDVVKVFSGFFDSKSIVEENSDKLDLVIYPGTSEITEEYLHKDEEVTFIDYEKTYHLYLFDVQYPIMSFASGDSQNFNYSGIKFNSNNNTSFIYYFVLSENVNSDYYNAEPSNLKQAILNGERNYVTTYSSLEFISIDFNSSTIEAIVDELGANISSLEILDNEGNSVYKENVILDFSQEFFIDNAEIISKLSKYTKDMSSADNENEQAKIEEEFGAYYTKWEKTFDNKGRYTFGYDSEYLVPDSLYFASIDKMIIYLVIVILAFILLFYRYEMKVLICKIFKKEIPEDTRVDNTISETTIEDDMIDVDNPK